MPDLCLSAPEPVFQFPVRVYWEDTDAGGVVFYANYLKFFERARTEWLRHAGLAQSDLRAEHGVLFVVSATQLRYLQPARLDDALRITVAQPRAGRARLSVQQQAWRGDTLLCEGGIEIACVEADTFRPRRIPPHVLERLCP